MVAPRVLVISAWLGAVYSLGCHADSKAECAQRSEEVERRISSSSLLQSFHVPTPQPTQVPTPQPTTCGNRCDRRRAHGNCEARRRNNHDECVKAPLMCNGSLAQLGTSSDCEGRGQGSGSCNEKFICPTDDKFNCQQCFYNLAGDDCQPSTICQANICDESAWPDVDKGIVCADCKVLVDNFDTKYQTCNGYCLSLGMMCAGAWEEESDDCHILRDLTCDEAVDSSDAICECQEKLKVNFHRRRSATVRLPHQACVEGCTTYIGVSSFVYNGLNFNISHNVTTTCAESNSEWDFDVPLNCSKLPPLCPPYQWTQAGVNLVKQLNIYALFSFPEVGSSTTPEQEQLFYLVGKDYINGGLQSVLKAGFIVCKEYKPGYCFRDREYEDEFKYLYASTQIEDELSYSGTVFGCQDECNKNASCRYFTWWPLTGHCRLSRRESAYKDLKDSAHKKYKVEVNAVFSGTPTCEVCPGCRPADGCVNGPAYNGGLEIDKEFGICTGYCSEEKPEGNKRVRYCGPANVSFYTQGDSVDCTACQVAGPKNCEEFTDGECNDGVECVSWRGDTTCTRTKANRCKCANFPHECAVLSGSSFPFPRATICRPASGSGDGAGGTSAHILNDMWDATRYNSNSR